MSLTVGGFFVGFFFVRCTHNCTWILYFPHYFYLMGLIYERSENP